jgi:oligopeptide transport system ATP-binding protein
MDTQNPQEKGQASVPDGPPLLRVEDLHVHFPITRGIVFQRQVGSVKAVDGVSFSIRRGETLGLVGESGCGKTTTGLAIMQLVQRTGGQIWFEGQSIEDLTRSGRKALYQRTQMIFQDPYASLNPRMTIGNIIADPIRVDGSMPRKETKERVRHLLESVRLDPAMVNRYPHQLSGGQRQRVGVARALALGAQFIVCDEPVSALDVSVQAQILNLMIELQQDLNLTYLFISHDLAVVRHISSRIAVMYLGKIVEMSDAQELYSEPRHPYTKALLSAAHTPDPRVERRRERVVLEGDLPSPAAPPKGCNFCTRCPLATEECFEVEPVFREVSDNHWAACHLVEPHEADATKRTPSKIDTVDLASD